MPKSLGNKYFEASDKGGKTAVEEFKGTFKEAGATEASPTSQSPFIQTATQQHVGAIVLAANDPKAVCADLKSAQQAGVKVVTFDSDTDCRDLFINQVTVQGVDEPAAWRELARAAAAWRQSNEVSFTRNFWGG